jgi:hypothetical protein
MNHKNEILTNKIKNGGNKAMNRAMKKLIVGMIGMMAMVIGIGSVVQADTISTNNATSLMITIRPNVDYGVEISSSQTSLELGYVEMNASTKTVHPATVTVMGNWYSTRLLMTSTITETSNNRSWGFDDVPASAEQDRLAVWAVFTKTATSDVPVDLDFENSNAVVTAAMAGDTPTPEQIGGTRFEITGGTAPDDMDALAPHVSRHLWVRMRTPSASSSSDPQYVRLNLTAQGN